MTPEAVERKKVPLCKIIFTCLFLFFSVAAFSQTVDCENNCALPECNFPVTVEKGCRCFDGIDNDPVAGQPQRFDKADPNCATYYGLTFVGEESSCDINVPLPGSPFDLVGPPAVSGQNTADTQSKVAIGDVDGDGIPDVVISSKWNSEIRVVATTENQAIDGSDAGDIKADFNLDGKLNTYFAANANGCELQNLLFEHEVLIADIDKAVDASGRKQAEIFGVVSNRKGSPKSPPTCFFLMGFKYTKGGDGLVPMYKAINLGSNRPGTFGIADMDGDGKAEIYLRDRIYAAETGVLLASGNGNWDLDITSGPVAVNISGDNKMELVCGTKIFSIPTLTNRNPGSPAALTLLHDMNTLTANKAYVKLMLDPVEYGEDTHSMCSVADIDNDGKMDVIISGALNSTSGPTAVFYWDVDQASVTYFAVPDPSYANGWPWGTSRVNLGNVDQDTFVELSFIAGTRLFCVEVDQATKALSQKWVRTVNDSRSGVLTVTLYDFNNDGLNEMVYRDSQELVIIDGLTGQTKLWSATCQSHTYTEGPVIADANGDGGTDICVACNRNNSFNINADIQQQALGEVRMFYSSGNEWLPTRKVWNQPGYFVVNINDDLTLPFPQFDGATVFAGKCDESQTPDIRPMNVFLNQVPFMTADGCPFFPQPDLAFYGDEPGTVDTNGDGKVQPFIEVDPPYCGSKTVKVTFHISNEGYLPINASVPVAFYNGNPKADPPGTFLYTTNLNINLPVGDTTSAVVSFNGPGDQFTLYVVLNNSGDPDQILETASDCRLANNIEFTVVTPKPFTITAAKVSDNLTCDPTINTGSAQLTGILNGTTVITDWSKYTFQWYSGPAAGPLTALAGQTNYILQNVPGGTYSLIVTTKDPAQPYCSSLPAEVVISNASLKPVFTVTGTPQTTCTPYNGTVTANFGGQSTAGMDLVWYNLNNEIVGQGVTALNGLKKDYYYLIATNANCPSDPVGVNVAGPVIPDGVATLLEPVQNCIDPSSGKITARPYDPNQVGQVPIADADTVKYSFAWYNYNNATSTQGSLLAPGAAVTVATRDVEEGSYSVVITDNATKCFSTNLIKVDVGNVLVIPTADIDVVSNQTSCDLNAPNGEFLGIALENGVPAADQTKYHFFWYLGQNTITKLTDTNGVIDSPTLTGVKGGGQMYTLQVISKDQDCEATFALAVPDLPVIPVVTLDSVNNSRCNSLSPIGSVTAKIFLNGTETTNYGAFSFNWDKGSSLTGVNPTPNSTNNILGTQPAGYYTLQVTETATTCKSAPVNIEVLDVLNYPDPVIDADPSTNCTTPPNSIIPDGRAEVLTIDGAADPNNGTFTYQWFNGLTEASPVSPAQTGRILANRQGPATFSVKITNTISGCTTLTPVQIADESVEPVVSLLPVDNDICNQALTSPLVDFKGSVTATITNQGANPLAQYSFSWFNKEFGANTSAGAWTKLDSGVYTLTVTHTPTGCRSSLVSAEVKNLTAIPFIEALATGSTNCPPTVTGNGSVKVDKVNSLTINAGSPFKFRWFEGQDLTGTLVTTSFQTTSTLQGGGSVYYTVEVTDNSNGCQSTETVLLPDNSALPIITLDQDPNTKCDDFNGAASIVTVTYKGNDITGAANLSYKWYNGTGAILANQRAETIDNLSGLQNGVFVSATATMTDLGCTSDFEAIEIQNGIVIPALTPSAVGSQNCTNTTPAGAPDGSVNVSALPADTYDFDWYSGNVVGAAGTEINSANSASVNGLQGGGNAYFTVLVTSQTTLCSSSATVLVTDDSQIPVLSPLTPTNNPNCPAFPDGTVNNPAGQVAFTGLTYKGAPIASPYTGFTFIWTGTGAPAAGANIPQLTGKPAGLYSLQVQHDVSKCLSDPVPATIIDALVYPDIDNAIVEQTSCDVNNPNGSITATVGGGTAGFQFAWFRGIGTSGAGVSETSEGFIEDLNSDDYTVRVHNTTTACTSVESLFLPDLITFPELDWMNVLPLTRCDVPNGEATPAVTNASGSFTIFTVVTPEDGTYPIDPTVILSTGSPQTDLSKVDNLSPGFVTGVVRNETTKCLSNPETVEIGNNIDQVAYSIDARAEASDCDPLVGGGISVSITGGVGPAFEYRWYKATPVNTNPDINFYNNPPDMGSAAVVNSDISDEDLGRPDAPGIEGVNGFQAGVYTLVINDLGNGCGTYFIDAIPLITSPSITVSKGPNTKCVNPDGFVQIDLTTVAAGPYQLNLYSGNGNTGTLLGTASGADPSLLVNSLPEGNYFIELVDNTVGAGGVLVNAACPIGEGTFVVKQTYDPIVSLTLKEANTSCDPSTAADGEVDIVIIPHSQNPPAHTFEIFDISPAPLGFAQIDNVAGNSINTVTGFGPTGYTVSARDEVSLCEGQGFITIPDQPVVPEILTVASTPDTYCFPLSNGQITITAVSPGAVNEYDYSWSDDPTLGSILFGPDPSPTYDNTKDGWKTGTVAGLGNGDHTYYVRGIKNTGDGVGCPTPIVMAVVNDAHVTPVLSLSSTPDTSCEGDGEGSVTVLASTNSADPLVMNATYTYVFDGASSGGHDGSTGFDYLNVDDGTYPVVATNEESQCVTQSSVTVDTFVFPLLIIDSDVNDQILCTNDGEILITNIEFNTGVVEAYNPANYSFQWFKAPAGSPGTFDPNAALTDPNSDLIAGDLLTVGTDPGEYASMEAGTYYVIAKRLDTTVPGAGCPTPPYRVDVLDRHENPSVQLTPFSDTSCDGSGEGSITVLISSDVAPAKLNVAPALPFKYEYTWAQAVPVPTPNESDGDEDGGDGDGDNPQSLVAGPYSLTVRNIITNCTIGGATTITLNETPVFIADVDSLNQTFCAPPNGAITVTQVDAQYPSGLRNAEPLNDFEYTWTQDGVVGSTTGPAQILPDLEAGTYYVVAKRTTSTNSGPGVGCMSAPRRVEVLDRTFLPNAALTPFADTGCSDDENFFEGSIRIDASENALSAGVGAQYSYFWTSADNTNTSTVLGNTTSGDGNGNIQGALRDDVYTVTITNTTTNCFVMPSTTITKSKIPVIILSASSLPKMICKPDGSAEVDQVLVGGSGDANFNNFDFVWYEAAFDDANIVLSGQNEFEINPTVYANFTANSLTYFVKAIRRTDAVNPDLSPAIGRGCESLPVSVTVADNSVDPVLSFTVKENSHCNPALSNATVTALAEEPDGTQDTYTFEWVLTGNTLPLTTNFLNPAGDGTYTVTATNDITGCPITNTVDVLRNLTLSQPNIVDVRGVDATDCFATGEAQVFFVTIGGTTTLPGNDPRFEYSWYETDPTDPSAQPIAGEISDLLPTIMPGTYFVKLEDTDTECQSGPTQVLVNKCLNCFVNVDIAQTLKQINCKTALNDFTGQLSAVALNHNGLDSNADPANFIFTWFNALDTVGTIYDDNDLAVLSNLQDGDYAVRVIDVGTNCRGKQYYIIQDDANVYKPELLLSPVGRQNCVTPDGALLIQQVADVPYNTPDYPFLPNYTATIQEAGAGASTPVPPTDPSATNPLSWYASPLDIVNQYTVVLIDNNTQCEVTQSISIPSSIVFPTVDIQMENPLQACNDDLANGQLSATADGGQISGYTFNWFGGEWSSTNEPDPTTAFVPPFAQVNKLIGVGRAQSADLTFTIKVTNMVTQCITYGNAELTESLIYPITVDAEVIQHNARCIEPWEGWVTGYVVADNGDHLVAGYNFYWSKTAPADSSPAGLEVEIDGRPVMTKDTTGVDAGTYYLIAEDINTGCPALATAVVENRQEIPNLVFKTTASFCADVPALNGKGTGSIELSLEPNYIVSDSIVWTELDGDFVGSGSYITELLPGDYNAFVLTDKGCSNENTANVPTEILTYNLVTQNNDGKNDRFVIDCISFFPNNNVKIFNRSGVLVYEGDYYDNLNTFFDGIGKNGIYMTGNVLPVGTYFYIIDKGDGSKPRTGYLELVR
jgi:hypothetical protein